MKVIFYLLSGKKDYVLVAPRGKNYILVAFREERSCFSCPSEKNGHVLVALWE